MSNEWMNMYMSDGQMTIRLYQTAIEIDILMMWQSTWTMMTCFLSGNAMRDVSSAVNVVEIFIMTI